MVNSERSVDNLNFSRQWFSSTPNLIGVYPKRIQYNLVKVFALSSTCNVILSNLKDCLVRFVYPDLHNFWLFICPNPFLLFTLHCSPLVLGNNRDLIFKDITFNVECWGVERVNSLELFLVYQKTLTKTENNETSQN